HAGQPASTDQTSTPQAEPMPIAVRAYAYRANEKPSKRDKEADAAAGDVPRDPEPLGPSEYALIFDCETFTDAAQQLRVGGYQLRSAGMLVEEGFFYDPLSLTDAERSTLYGYAAEHGLNVRTV